MRRKSNWTPIIFCFVILGLFFVLIARDAKPRYSSDSPSRGGSLMKLVLDLPAELIVAALHAGVVDAMAFGTPEELHRFGKGLPTRFGQMSFATDDYLTERKGWSEEQVHRVGFAFGFSELWDDRRR